MRRVGIVHFPASRLGPKSTNVCSYSNKAPRRRTHLFIIRVVLAASDHKIKTIIASSPQLETKSCEKYLFQDSSDYTANIHANVKMAPEYAKHQPGGFVNRIEKVAIVGVGIPSHLKFEMCIAS